MTRPTIATLTSGISSDAASTLSFSHVHSGNDLVVLVLWRDTAGTDPVVVSDVTYPVSGTPTSLTFKARGQINWAGDNFNTCEIWHTQNADAGSNTVAITLSEEVALGDVFHGIALAFNDSDGLGTNVGQASGNGSTFAVTISTNDANSLIVAGLQTHNSFPITEDASVTEQYEVESSNVEAWVGTMDATGGSDTVTATAPGGSRFGMAAVEVLEAAAGGATVTVNQVLETDLAQVLGRLKEKALGLNTEADLAQQLTRLKTKALGLITETDLAQGVAWAPKHRLVTQVAETDLSQVVGKAKAKSLGLTTETDLAQVLSKLKTKTLGLTTETDTARPMSSLKTVTVNIVTETDLAQPITVGGAIFVTVNQVLETDVAQSIAWAPKHRLVGQVTETDLAQAIAKLKTVQVGQATETDLAQALSKIKTLAIGQAIETDLAQAITLPGAIFVTVNLVTETDAAQAVTSLKTKAIGQATEAELAQAIASLKTVQVSQVVETDLAQAIARLKTRAIGQATEADLAQALSKLKTVQVNQITETDLAQAIAWAPKHRLVGQAVETDLAQSIIASIITAVIDVVLEDAAVYSVELTDSGVYIVTLSDAAVYGALITDATRSAE